jgi:histidine phosphotransferase ChpT
MTDTPDLPPPTPLPSSTELAASLAARLCHDLISPASAVVSGVDLLEDPDAQDMRDDAISLITASARKLAAVLSFCRVAFGASSSADTFDSRELKKLAQGMFDHHKAALDWQVGLEALNKPAARSILNLAEIGGSCLARGGVVELGAEQNGDGILLTLKASGDRVRMWPEVARGLAGEALDEGLTGRWVQSYYLSRIVDEAGGQLSFEADEAAVTAKIQLPL